MSESTYEAALAAACDPDRLTGHDWAMNSDGSFTCARCNLHRRTATYPAAIPSRLRAKRDPETGAWTGHIAPREVSMSDMYLDLADAMGYESGKDGIQFSPEEWAAALLKDALRYRWLRDDASHIQLAQWASNSGAVADAYADAALSPSPSDPSCRVDELERVKEMK